MTTMYNDYDAQQSNFDSLFESMFEAGGMEKSAYQDVLDNPKFQRWFKGSEVVDDEDNPVVLYHGTSAEIKKFDVSKGDNFGIHFGTYYQAENRTSANDLKRAKTGAGVHDPAGFEGETPGSNVTPVFLKITNPLEIDDVSEWDDPQDIASGLIAIPEFENDEDLKDILNPVDEYDAKEVLGFLRDIIKKAGYDGITYLNIYEADAPRQGTSGPKSNPKYSWIIFDSSQVKSAIANKGTYNNSGDMLETLVI